jgi:flagellar biosynthesis/type III secretory pathway chaperone
MNRMSSGITHHPDRAIADAPMPVFTRLREKLFDMAAAPTTCADAGTQLFNAMGVEVLVHEAYALVNKGLVESELVSLAQGRSRLDELSKIGRARVVELEQQGRIHPRYDADGHLIPLLDEDGNFVRYIDEVQIHMTYGTALAERLDLPWQSRLMRFEEPDVTLMMIEAAYRRVLALEEGDLLRDSIIEQDFWRTYIQGSNRRAFNELRRRTDAALDLQIAQAEWGRSADLSERSRLRGKITALAKVLGKPESDVPLGRVMTDAEYSAELESIEAEKQSLLKKLTQEAMDRAKLQRAQIPFEVESGH